MTERKETFVDQEQGWKQCPRRLSTQLHRLQLQVAGLGDEAGLKLVDSK